MRIARNLMLTAASALLAGLWSSGGLQAQTDFRGKTITVYAGGQPGAGVDLFTRTFMPHYANHLPGNPTIIVRNMFGAGGMQAVAFTYAQGAKDGTAMTTMAGGPIQAAAFGDEKLDYDIRGFEWVGSLSSGRSMCFVWHTHPFNNVADMQAKEMTISATGARSNSTLLPIMVNRTLGTKMKPIAGYGGAGSVLAVERGEVDGRCLTYDSLKTSRPDWISEKKVKFLLDVTIDPNPELPPGVPNIMNLIKDPQDKLAMQLFLTPSEITVPFALAPGTPKEAVATHRAAFTKAVQDPKYLADAEKRRQDISPRDGEQVAKLLNELFTAPPAVIARVKEYLADESGIGRCQGDLCSQPKKK